MNWRQDSGGEMEGLERESFAGRHIGPNDGSCAEMLRTLGCSSLDELVSRVIPRSIRRPPETFEALGAALSEAEALAALREILAENDIRRSYIGMGYANTFIPSVIRRNIFENPGWYTQYTPYQPEISQGRLEALLNYQTMICDLTGMAIANASLLDEGTAAAEAMTMSLSVARREDAKSELRYFVSDGCHPQTIEVIRGRAWPLGIEVMVGPIADAPLESVFGLLLQYPASEGSVRDLREFVARAREAKVVVSVATDLLALTLLAPPGEWGADIVVGNAQRFGVPFGFGGPHAAFFATRDEWKRMMPGRLVGVSKDARGRPALRLALQTREQHIRREKATSNICTAQVLLAVLAGMYAVYHGPQGLRRIAQGVHSLTCALSAGLEKLGLTLASAELFDTVTVKVSGEQRARILQRLESAEINVRQSSPDRLSVSLDETTRESDIVDILRAFSGEKVLPFHLRELEGASRIPEALRRTSAFLTHPVFNSYHSETEMLRYIRRLESRDLSLTASMIPLGSCTMKLNATSEMLPVTWPEVSSLHPFAPAEQSRGYRKMFRDLEDALKVITGFAGVSLQPNAGSQGEFAGLLVIRRFFEERQETRRNICLIPRSAHGTNPASAVMAGYQVVVVDCDSQGNIDLASLRARTEEFGDRVAALMVTYPSTHGVFEEQIRGVCDIVHRVGGQVYMDGANLNAQVGLCRPADIGADVCHINLHKTFCIPHGGGGPGMGPIAVGAHLAPFLPNHPFAELGHAKGVRPVSSAPWGSSSILPISWMYMRMMGAEGLQRATEVAILNANYIARRLEKVFPVLYRGVNGFVAHECILDLRPLKLRAGVEVDDVAKRLMDYGFHAPTVSFPVAGTLMVEPTESESKLELDRFCDAMLSIGQEIEAVASGRLKIEESPLRRAPHTLDDLTEAEWDRPYSRAEAVTPSPATRQWKFWPSVNRIDGSYGDRNLVCSCLPIEAYEVSKA